MKCRSIIEESDNWRRLAKDRLGDFHPALCQSIGLWESLAAGLMLEVKFMGKMTDLFALELWTVITDNSIRNSMCNKDVLKLADHFCCSRGVKSDNFQPRGIVVSYHRIVLAVEGKEIRPQLLQWSTR